jgi:lipoic acid synthetase
MNGELLVQLSPNPSARQRLPEWLRKGQTHFQSVQELKTELRRKRFHRGAATFMILGNLCTRGCGFCSVPKGSAAKREFFLDADEPAHVAEMAAEMNLRYVVITSVNRDDLDDGGSVHFAETVRQVRARLPNARVEVLTPDFEGNMDAVARVLDAGPHVYNHNMETVGRLYKRVRPQAKYQQSLDVLAFAKRYRPDVLTKSGLMVGLGETVDEVQELLRDVHAASTDVATIGQYLQPTLRNLKVAEYVTPAKFEAYREYGLSLGFKMVFSGPFVRSSYMADQVSEAASVHA